MTNQTISKLYDDFTDANETVQELEAAGVPHAHISLVANNADGRLDVHNEHIAKDAGVGAGAGAILGGGAGLLAGLGTIAIPGVGPVVAAGWLVASLAGLATGAAAGAATGGVVGALTKEGVNADHADLYAEGIRRGGALVSVKTDDKWQGIAEEIMNRRLSVDPDGRANTYRAAGWNAFDVSTPPYTREQIAQERDLYRN